MQLSFDHNRYMYNAQIYFNYRAVYHPLPEDIGAFKWFLGNIEEQQ